MGRRSGANNISISGGIENVSGGGTASATTLDSGGVQNVSSGAVPLDTVINNGGVENISSGGAASGVLVYSGTQNVFSGGTASAAIVNGTSGTLLEAGSELVYGLALGEVIYGGGGQTVELGGTASGAGVDFGGTATFFIAASAAASEGMTQVAGARAATKFTFRLRLAVKSCLLL
jgi:autotransporter passenger strand-loop-strand repeat protein